MAGSVLSSYGSHYDKVPKIIKLPAKQNIEKLIKGTVDNESDQNHPQF